MGFLSCAFVMEELTGWRVEDILGYAPSTTALTLSDFDATQMIDFHKTSFWIAFVSFGFAPTFWNIVGRLEYRTHLFSKLFCGQRYLACYILALIIFCLQLERDFAFNLAM